MDLLRKLLLTAVTALLASPDNITVQMSFGFLVTLLFFLAHNAMGPYVADRDDEYMWCSMLSILLIVFSGLVLKAGESSPKNPYQDVGVTVLLMSCTIGVLLLFLYMTFKGDKGGGYASIQSADDGASRVILVKGSATPPPYASFLALCRPPPPLYEWDKELPSDAYGVLDPQEYTRFITDLNCVGAVVNAVNARESHRRVVFIYAAMPMIILGGVGLVFSVMMRVPSIVPIIGGALCGAGVVAVRWTQLSAAAMESSVGDASDSFADTSDFGAFARNVPAKMGRTTMNAYGGVQVLHISVIDAQTSDLAIAAREGHCSDLHSHVSNPACAVNAAGDDGATALHEAAGRGQADAVSILLVAGANANQKNNAGWNAMMCAANWGFEDATRMLIDAKCNVDAADFQHGPP